MLEASDEEELPDIHGPALAELLRHAQTLSGANLEEDVGEEDEAIDDEHHGDDPEDE
jgi:hypothetical protein